MILQNLYTEQTDLILRKAALRTANFSETFYAPAKPDTRNAQVVAYEIAHFDNVESPAYGDWTLARVWAMTNGISAKELVLRHAPTKLVEFSRAVVVVPINIRNHKWDEEGDVKVDTAYICVKQEGTSKFRDAAGNLVVISGSQGHMLRPATEDEITALVNALMVIRPTETIRVLGDAAEFTGIS